MAADVNLVQCIEKPKQSMENSKKVALGHHAQRQHVAPALKVQVEWEHNRDDRQALIG